MADHRPITYLEGQAVVYRASAIGGCPTALAYSRLGFEPGGTPERVREVAERGCELEPVALASLEARGWRVAAQQQEIEREVALPGGRIALVRGHVDAVGDPQDGDGRVLIEVKSRNAADYARFVRDGLEAVPRQHLWQASAYAHILGVGRVAYVAICRESEEVHTWLGPAPVPWGDIEARVREVEAQVAQVEEACLWEERDPDPADLPACHGDRAVWCSYYGYHAPRPYEDGADIAHLLTEYHEAQVNEAAWREIRDALRPQLKAAMGERARVTADGIAAEVRRNGTLVVRRLEE